jgi:hypothetical protein
VYRHIVLFKFDPSATAEDRQRGAEALEAMPASVPEIRSLTLGWNAGGATNYDLALTVEFDDAAGFAVYGPSEAHQHAWLEVLKPVVAQLAVIQYDTGG